MPIQDAWRRYVGSLRGLLTGLPEHRHQDQFFRIRDEALALGESAEMADEVASAYKRTIETEPNNRAAEIVVMELEDFPRAVEVYQEEVKAGAAKTGARKQLLVAAKTILGSVHDVLSLNPWGKGVICVLKEAIGLVAGGGE
jgi:hypothetical protein